jgi:hypothetical protein
MPFQHDPTPMLCTLQLGNSPPAHHTALPSRHAMLLGVSMPSRSPTAHTVQGRSRSSSRPTLPLLYFSLLCLTVPLPHVSRPRAATPDRSITWPSFTPPSPHAADPSRPAPCRLPAARSFACAFPSSTIPPRDNPTPNHAQPPRRPLCYTMSCPRTALRCIKTPSNTIPLRIAALRAKQCPAISVLLRLYAAFTIHRRSIHGHCLSHPRWTYLSQFRTLPRWAVAILSTQSQSAAQQ